jgi:aspartyl-tRNA(Asn)/glutamyl-tRNA(Gln) amidotransferase subunit C
MSLSKQDVEKIANLARLDLTAQEKALYQEQLSAVLEYARRLQQLDLEGVPPTASAVAQTNIMRDDEVKPSLPLTDTLYNAASKAEAQFLIQPVLDEA